MTATMTRPWADIEDYYRQLAERSAPAKGMLRLVERIRSSTYVRALFAWTSIPDLCIVQVPCTYPYDGPFLRISPQSDGSIAFRFIDTPFESKQWHRVVIEEDAFRRLERFIDQLHWVVREKTRDPSE
jgi:hypothetical protein